MRAKPTEPNESEQKGKKSNQQEGKMF